MSEEIKTPIMSIVPPIEGQQEPQEPQVEASSPIDLPVLEKDETLVWEPTALISITGEQFGILNMCMRQVLGKLKNFSFEDFLTQSPEFSLVFTARKTCEEIVAKMREEGIATTQKK